MFRIMLQKLWHKKWMNFCLLLGSMLLIATAVSFPLYQTAAYDRMLQDEFKGYISSEGGWPTAVHMMLVSKKDKQGTAIPQMEGYLEQVFSDLGVTKKETVNFYALARANVHSAWERYGTEETGIRLAAVSGLPGHAKMLSGEMYSDSGLTEDGAIEVVVSENDMILLDVLVGETLIFNDLRDANGKEIRLYVKGVYAPEDYREPYWQTSVRRLEGVCMMNMDLFRSMFTGKNAAKYTINCDFDALFEYEDITADRVADLLETTRVMTEESAYRNTLSAPEYRSILEEYQKKQGRIEATLMILQIPVFIMLGAFLFMISGQMYDMERNEISVIKSRGSSGGQIFRLYLYQSFFLALVGGVLGIPLGTVFSRILGSARSFLEFDSDRTLTITFTVTVWWYAAAAMGVTLLIMAIPAIRHSKVTIVNLKQQKAVKRKSLWEKLFLDVILLGVSFYGYYSFRRNADRLATDVLQGEALDPLLYISSSLFILGAGLLFLRLQPYLVQLIYTMGKKFWRPASYASFMENLKNGRKQQFIMLFLIMTISMGMYHATVARTILRNACDNTSYINGADIVVKEVWTEVKTLEGTPTGEYIEPDYSKYAAMDFASAYTRVMPMEGMSVKTSEGRQEGVTLLGIHTKEFGGITWVDQSLNGQHYYELLNALAVEPEGVLLSANFRDKLGLSIGDSVTFRGAKESSTDEVKGKVVGFFDYFPGYIPSAAGLNPDGSVSVNENYLMVTHLNRMTQRWGVKPYEVWISKAPGCTPETAYNWFEGNNIRLTKYVDRDSELENTVRDPLLQGTNGVLTMGFIVTILLCAVGYLIYWILSIRSREMIFGVLRACGMHKGELIHMLMNEQVFSGVFSVFAGIGIGKLTSKMFVPMMQQAYAATNQVLPMKLVVNSADMARLYVVIVGVMIVCLAVLILLIFKLNVTKALKLGEE